MCLIFPLLSLCYTQDMKILYDTKIFEYQIFGGISLYFTRLFEEFCHDDAVDVEVPYLYSDNYYIQNKSFSPKLRLYPKPFPFKKQVLKLLKNINKYRTIWYLKYCDYDVFHPTYFNDYYIDILKKRNKPFVLTVHDMTVEALNEYFLFDKKMTETIEVKKKLIKNAARVIAISESTKDDILKYTNIDENKIDIVYHGAPLGIDEEYEHDEDLPNRYILYVGQRGKYKNFNNFLSAIAPLLLEDDSLYLVMAGGPPVNKSEKEFIDNLGVYSKIYKTPIKNDSYLFQLYKGAICFVYPSLYEGFGFPILEAFQAECPLACSNLSSFPEIAGDATLYFNPYDEDSIRDAVKTLINDEGLSKALVEKGKLQLEKFSWKGTACKTKAVYAKIACSNSNGK